jgi:hypothetical protein
MVPRLGVQMKMPKFIKKTWKHAKSLRTDHSLPFLQVSRSYRLATKHVNLDFVTSLRP